MEISDLVEKLEESEKGVSFGLPMAMGSVLIALFIGGVLISLLYLYMKRRGFSERKIILAQNLLVVPVLLFSIFAIYIGVGNVYRGLDGFTEVRHEYFKVIEDELSKEYDFVAADPIDCEGGHVGWLQQAVNESEMTGPKILLTSEDSEEEFILKIIDDEVVLIDP